MTITEGVRRFDIGQITSIEKTPQGFLKVPGFATRVGVFAYRDQSGSVRRELRHPDDVFAPESLATLKNAPVTQEHPPVMLTPENVKQFIKGYTTDRVEVNRDLVETDLIIADSELIQAVEQKQARELSCGYLADLVEEEGTFNGNPYDCRQKNIRYNHLAVVRGGRGGPEVRLRMDSKDAIMEVQSGNSQSEKAPQADELKPIVILGKEVQLPSDVADAVQALMDRYDEMRAKFMETEDAHMKKTDVDVSQPGISPKVPEVQGAPDGRNASGKVGPGDTGGAATAKGKTDDDTKAQEGVVGGVEKSGRDDDGAAQVGAVDAVPANVQPGAGVPSDLDVIKHELAEMKAKNDALQARVDEYASASMGKAATPMGGQKMDSADFRSNVQKRVKLERTAEALLPAETCAKFDSMSDDEIRSAVIKHRHPNADLAGKSAIYLQTRFDSITESLEESRKVRTGMGSAMMRADSNDGPAADPKSARMKMIEASRSLHTMPLSANRK
jgi:uncharacterized protein